jgi:carbon-monoxide dehydrogenase iron sulfur subunit
MKRIYARDEICIGCRLCEVYCVVQHSGTHDLVKAFTRERPRPTARIVVDEEGSLSFGTQCVNCDEPACVYACISGAMQRGPDGVVRLDEERCIGCWTCIAVCPYGAIRRSADERPTAAKCDLCPDLDVPACVANCPNEALVLQEHEVI